MAEVMTGFILLSCNSSDRGRGKRTGYANYLLHVYSKLQQKALHTEENKGYENAKLKIKL